MASTLWSSGPDHCLEILGDRSGGFGWSFGWHAAMNLAHDAVQQTGKRHRVYWSPNGRAWMIRRAFMFNSPALERTIERE